MALLLVFHVPLLQDLAPKVVKPMGELFEVEEVHLIQTDVTLAIPIISVKEILSAMRWKSWTFFSLVFLFSDWEDDLFVLTIF